MKKVLFVCMGNICRSPTAHAVMQEKVDRRALNELVSIDSAGTHAYHVGEQSDSRSRLTASERGIDMEFIRARKISANDYDVFDYILAMDKENLELINEYAPANYSAKIALFLSYAHKAKTCKRMSVPDPYYGGDSGFTDVFDLVSRGCDALLDHLLSAEKRLLSGEKDVS